MKTSGLIASALFGSLALAAPFRRRAMLTKTEVVVETEVVYVTVWDGQVPVTEPTSTPANFYEQPAPTPAQPSPTLSPPKYEEKKPEVPSPAPAPSSVYTPPPPPPSSAPPKEEPAYTPAPTPSPAPAPEPQPEPEPEPEPQPEPQPQPEEPKPGNGGGKQFHGEVTMYNSDGAMGACGNPLGDDKFYAAVSVADWGSDVWVDNKNQNPWCGKKATVTLNGKTVDVTIQDKCMGCKPGDIDLTLAAWNKLTDNAYGSREQGAWVA